jgi:hypothetical protein
MATLPFEGPPSEDPHAQLERAFLDEYLRAHGTSLDTLAQLPPEHATALLSDASRYASGRLTEVESRAHFVEELHRGPQPLSSNRPKS